MGAACCKKDDTVDSSPMIRDKTLDSDEQITAGKGDTNATGTTKTPSKTDDAGTAPRGEYTDEESDQPGSLTGVTVDDAAVPEDTTVADDADEPQDERVDEPAATSADDIKDETEPAEPSQHSASVDEPEEQQQQDEDEEQAAEDVDAAASAPAAAAAVDEPATASEVKDAVEEEQQADEETQLIVKSESDKNIAEDVAAAYVAADDDVKKEPTEDEDSDDAVEEAPELTEEQKKERITRSATLTDSHIAFSEMLKKGDIFLKHGRRGKPKKKNVFMSDSLRIFWCDPEKKSIDRSRVVDLVDVTAVKEGHQTKVFDRKSAKVHAPELCFSLITKDRTLDLTADTKGVRDLWVSAIAYMLRKVNGKKE